MKKVILFILFAGWVIGLCAQVNSNIQTPLSINESGADPDVSAVLDIGASDKGILIPRMTMMARDGITTPATGLMIYQTDNTPGFYYYDGSEWESVGGGAAMISSSIQDSDGNTMVQTEQNPDDNVIRFDLDGEEKMALVKNSNGIARLDLFNTGGNVAIGENAGRNIDPSTGLFNTFLGKEAGYLNSTGDRNTANGYRAFYSNTTGSFNVANGTFALFANSTGLGNTADGYYALSSNSEGSYNTATGLNTLANNTLGSRNTVVGSFGLNANITGSYNTAIGSSALAANTSGRSNTAAGGYALFGNTTGFSNVAIGAYSLYENTNRSNLVAVGDSALYNNGLGAAESYHSTENTAIGSNALYFNTTGFSNTAIGYEVLYSNITGFFNTVTGTRAMFDNVDGSRNTAYGYETLAGNNGGFNNVAYGYRAIRYSGSGNNNTACGYEALFSTAGSYNTALGYKAGDYSGGEKNTFIGANAEATAADLTNATAIGANAQVAASNSFILGDASVSVGIGTTAPSEKLEVNGNVFAFEGDFYAGLNNGVINCGGGKMAAFSNYIGDTYTVPTQANGDEDLYIDDVLEVGNDAYKPGGGSWLATSDSRLKKDIKSYKDGLEQILQINPVYFKYNNKTNYADKDKEYVGIIAQDMLDIAPYMVEEKAFWQEVREDENGKEHITKAGEQYYVFDPSALPYMLVNAIKEQQGHIEYQTLENEALKNRLNRLEAALQDIIKE